MYVNKLLSLQNLNQDKTDLKRDDSLENSEPKNFKDKVNYYEKLLNSIHTSPLLKWSKSKINQEEDSVKKQLFKSNEKDSTNEYRIKIKNEEKKVVKEVEYQIPDIPKSESEEEIPKVSVKNQMKLKSNLFNLVSIWKRDAIKKEKTEEVKIESGTIETNLETEEHIETNGETDELNEGNLETEEPIEELYQESITDIRRKHKKEHKKENPKNDLEMITKALIFDSKNEEVKDEENKILVQNPFETSIDDKIQAIEEVSNETFTTINENRELQQNDGSLFGWPQTSIFQEENKDAQNTIDISFSENKEENEGESEVSEKKVHISSVSFQKRDESQNNIKELFNTSPIISSPDFEQNHKQKLSQSQQEINGKAVLFIDLEIQEFSLNLENDPSIEDPSPVKVNEERKEMNISPPMASESQDVHNNSKFLHSFCQSLSRTLAKNQWKSLKSCFEILKSWYHKRKAQEAIEKQKQAKLKIIRGGIYALNIIFNQQRKKNLLQSLNLLNKYSIEKKITISNKTSFAEISNKEMSIENIDISSTNMSKYRMFMLLKNSVSYIKYKKFIEYQHLSL